MAVPQSKEQLLEAIDKNYSSLKTQIERFPPSDVMAKVMDGHAKGTVMSLHNLLSYLIGWGQLVLKWQEKRSNITAIDFPETHYKWNELGKLAQKFYEDYHQIAFDDLCKLLDSTVLLIKQNINQTSQADLYENQWYGKWTLGRMIQFNTASPYKNAKGRISKYLKSI